MLVVFVWNMEESFLHQFYLRAVIGIPNIYRAKLTLRIAVTVNSLQFCTARLLAELGMSIDEYELRETVDVRRAADPLIS